jgi:hypothetical protein
MREIKLPELLIEVDNELHLREGKDSRQTGHSIGSLSRKLGSERAWVRLDCQRRRRVPNQRGGATRHRITLLLPIPPRSRKEGSPSEQRMAVPGGRQTSPNSPQTLTGLLSPPRPVKLTPYHRLDGHDLSYPYACMTLI